MGCFLHPYPPLCGWSHVGCAPHSYADWGQGWHGWEILETLKGILSDSMINASEVDVFKKLTYTRQDNDEATTTVKQILNYFISYEWRGEIMDRLMGAYFDSETDLIKDFYLSREDIKELYDAGHLIGSHTVSHPVMSKLSTEDQRRELDDSFSLLEDIVGAKGLSFCYPYGGFHSFSDETEALLTAYGCPFALNVEARDVTSDDLLKRPQALPRYDCCIFPHGRASFGIERPTES